MWWSLILLTIVVAAVMCLTIGVWWYVAGVLVSFVALVLLFNIDAEGKDRLDKKEYLIVFGISLYSWVTLALVLGLSLLNKGE